MIQVSVVVPTCRRPQLLRRCLEALLAQEFDPAAYEVIVVDDAPNRQTKELVEAMAGPQVGTGHNGASATMRARLAARGAASGQIQGRPAASWQQPQADWPAPCPHLRYVPVTGAQHGPAAARNIGWRAARGLIIAFTDDDCLPDSQWLRRGLSPFAERHIVGVAGTVEVPLPEEPTDYELNAAGMGGIQFLTANCFYRRQALAETGGFDERFKIAWREDSDLFFTLLERYGEQHLVHAPSAVVRHPVRPAPWGISISQQRKSFFNALLYRKHPELYRALIQASPPWHYYQIVGTLLLALLAALAGWSLLALAAAAAWFWLTGRFCARRLQRTSRAPGHVVEMAATSAVIPWLAIFWRLAGAFHFRVFFL